MPEETLPTASDGKKEQAISLLAAMQLFKDACGQNPSGALASNKTEIMAAFEAVVVAPLLACKVGNVAPPATKKQIKIVEFIKRVSEIVDVNDTDGNGLKAVGNEGAILNVADGKTTMKVMDGKGLNITRTQETAVMDHENLKKVAAWYEGGAGKGANSLAMPLPMKQWQNEMLGYKVTALANIAIEQERAVRIDDFLEKAKLQIPAKLRVAGLGNMRVHTVTCTTTPSGAEILSAMLPHASHDAHDLKNPKQEVEVAKRAMESVMRSSHAKDQRGNLKKMLNLDDSENSKEILKEYAQNLGITLEDASSVDKMLDKLMPQFMTVDRLTSLFASKDLNTSMVIDKAIMQIQADKSQTIKIMGTHHTIQSGFSIFAAISAPFVKSQNQIAADELNKQTKVAIAILTQQLDSKVVTAAEKLKIKSKITVLDGVNARFNKGLSASNNAAIMYGGTLRVSLGLIVAGASALVAVAILPALPFFAAAAIAATAIAIPITYINRKMFAANKMASNFKGLKGGSLLIVVAAALVVTAPISLPILGGLSVIAMAGIAVGTGFIGAVGAMVASKYRDLSFLGGYKNSSSNHTWNSALQNLNVSLVGGIADLACHEGKDRTGTVLMTVSAIQEYIGENGKCPDINNTNDQLKLAQSFDKIIMSGHDAERTSFKCAGAASVKKLQDYIPPAIYEKMQETTKQKIRDYAAITKYFSLAKTYNRSATLPPAFLQEKLVEFPLLAPEIQTVAKNALKASIADIPAGIDISEDAKSNIQVLDQISRGVAVTEIRPFENIMEDSKYNSVQKGAMFIQGGGKVYPEVEAELKKSIGTDQRSTRSSSDLGATSKSEATPKAEDSPPSP